MQLLPQALPVLHTLQHWSAGMQASGEAAAPLAVTPDEDLQIYVPSSFPAVKNR